MVTKLLIQKILNILKKQRNSFCQIFHLLNIFIKSIRVRKIVIRDFNEIEKLQSSLKNNYAFEQKSFHKTQEEITNILKN